VLFAFDQNYAINPAVLVGVLPRSVLTAYQASRCFPPNPLDEPGDDARQRAGRRASRGVL